MMLVTNLDQWMLVDVVDAETAEDVYSENQALLLPSPSMAKRQEPPPHVRSGVPLKRRTSGAL